MIQILIMVKVLSEQRAVCSCVSVAHLAVIHFVAKFLSKRFGQGNVYNIAHYTHSKGIASKL